jgi:ribosomal protein L1
MHFQHRKVIVVGVQIGERAMSDAKMLFNLCDFAVELVEISPKLFITNAQCIFARH